MTDQTAVAVAAAPLCPFKALTFAALDYSICRFIPFVVALPAVGPLTAGLIIEPIQRGLVHAQMAQKYKAIR